MQHSRFFGLHFDFHAGNQYEIGHNTLAKDIAWYIEQARPDFVQCDCKGHPGNSCYPTKVGKAADKLLADNLRVWVDTIHSYGLPAYVHYSGIMDVEYIKAHPEAAVVNEDGTINQSCTSVFSSYVDDLMIPQLKELIDEYGIDGVWVDGDNWAVYRDYSDNTKPYLSEGMSYAAHNRIMREGFMRYIKRYVDELHKYNPMFSIGSNWMYTSQVPEEPTIDVDYISGDFDPANSAHRIRYETRCIAHQGKPWDLMSWSFGTEYNSYGIVSKSAEQMMQEAAMVTSLGGGYQMYIVQNRDGSAARCRKDTYRRVGEFMHERRFLYGKEPIAQLAILYSAEARYQQTASDPCVYNPPNNSVAVKGLLHAVLDAGYTADIVLEHQLDRLDRYEAVLIPEWERMADSTEAALLQYADRGGTVIVVGAASCKRFGKLIGVDFEDVDTPFNYLVDDSDECMSISGSKVNLKQGKSGLYFMQERYRSPFIPLYRVDKKRDGRFVFFACDFGTAYDHRKSYVGAGIFRKFLDDILTPWLKVDEPSVDVILQNDGEDVLMNLVNLKQNRHSMEYIVFDTVPYVNDVTVTVNLPFRKAETVLGEPCEFEYDSEGKLARILVKRLDIHTVIRLTK